MNDESRKRIAWPQTIQYDMDEAQRQRLHDVADRCPVHRTLTKGVVVVDADPEGVEAA